MRDANVVTIPKAGHLAHVESNRRAADLVLDASTLAALDRAFPPPRHKTALAIV
jgi:diketogulonate reductase-like aldo/keto reductase